MKWKKSQIMSEFLITYGWAVLIVLIMIAAMAGISQVGIIKSDHVVPEKCILQVGLACIDQNVKSNSVTLRLINGFGKNVYIINMTIGENCTKEFNFRFESGASHTFTLTDCSNGKKNSRFDKDILIYYRDDGRTMIKRMSGKITSKVR